MVGSSSLGQHVSRARRWTTRTGSRAARTTQLQRDRLLRQRGLGSVGSVVLRGRSHSLRHAANVRKRGHRERIVRHLEPGTLQVQRSTSQRINCRHAPSHSRCPHPQPSSLTPQAMASSLSTQNGSKRAAHVSRVHLPPAVPDTSPAAFHFPLCLGVHLAQN